MNYLKLTSLFVFSSLDNETSLNLSDNLLKFVSIYILFNKYRLCLIIKSNEKI